MSTPFIIHRKAFTISTARDRLDLKVIHQYLSEEAYWSKQVPLEIIQKSIDHSLPFGLYERNAQIGFARIISDYATFAYLADVFILPGYQGQGLGKWLLSAIQEHPDLQGLRRWLLMTMDAQSFYAQMGWQVMDNPSRCMVRVFKTTYPTAP